jgi:hypothetical protein
MRTMLATRSSSFNQGITEEGFWRYRRQCLKTLGAALSTGAGIAPY